MKKRFEFPVLHTLAFEAEECLSVSNVEEEETKVSYTVGDTSPTVPIGDILS